MVKKKYFKDVESVNEEKVLDIASNLQFYSNETELFSPTGCKGIEEKVDFSMRSNAFN